MSTSRQTAILSEVAAKRPSVGTQAYFQSKAMSAFYTFVVQKFLEKERAGELSRADLARRARKDPAVITRLLSKPSNMTLGTLSDLLLAIDGEEPIPQSAPILRYKPFPSSIWEMPKKSPATSPKQPSPSLLDPPPSANKPEKSELIDALT